MFDCKGKKKYLDYPATYKDTHYEDFFTPENADVIKKSRKEIDPKGVFVDEFDFPKQLIPPSRKITEKGIFECTYDKNNFGYYINKKYYLNEKMTLQGCIRYTAFSRHDINYNADVRQCKNSG